MWWCPKIDKYEVWHRHRGTSTRRKAHTNKQKHIDTGTSASALETSGWLDWVAVPECQSATCAHSCILSTHLTHNIHICIHIYPQYLHTHIHLTYNIYIYSHIPTLPTIPTHTIIPPKHNTHPTQYPLNPYIDLCTHITTLPKYTQNNSILTMK